MKNLITGIAFVCLTLLSANTLTAQSLSRDADKPEVIAKTTVSNLVDELQLTGDQERALFRAYVQKEVNYKKHVNGKDIKSAAVKAEKQKHDIQLIAMVKNILTDVQYKKWQALQPQ